MEPMPSSIYVWLVRSEEMLDQPGSWRIRKWDIEPFPEANFVAGERDLMIERCAEVADREWVGENSLICSRVAGKIAKSIRALKSSACSATPRSEA